MQVMPEICPMLRGFAIKSKTGFNHAEFERFLSSFLVQENEVCDVRISNGNWDTQKSENGSVVGVYDDIVIKYNYTVLTLPFDSKILLSSGLAAWWNREEQTLTLVSGSASSRKIFYRILPTGVVFSSDMRLLIRPEDNLDPVGAGQLVVYGTTGGSRSIISGVKMPVVRIVRAALGNPRHFQNSAYSLVWTVVFAEKQFAGIKDRYE